MIGTLVVCVIFCVVALVVWDQRRIRKMRHTLAYDPVTKLYSWTDLNGDRRSSETHPGKEHTDFQVGGAWGDGAGPPPES